MLYADAIPIHAAKNYIPSEGDLVGCRWRGLLDQEASQQGFTVTLADLPSGMIGRSLRMPNSSTGPSRPTSGIRVAMER
jgi:hypothetical protein